MSDEQADLGVALADLRHRVEALERAGAPGGSPGPGRVDWRDLEDGTVLYAGKGTGPDGRIELAAVRQWSEVVAAPAGRVAGLMAALANPARVRIVQSLLAGPADRSALSTGLDDPSVGQLSHHLKELLAAGVVHQPRRGVYAIAPARVVPLLALLSIALDLAADPAGTTP
jgi:DNA-binding transcriptional ArsR family regulator